MSVTEIPILPATNSPARSSNIYNDEMLIRNDVNKLITKEISHSSLPYSSLLQLPSVTRDVKVSFDYSNARSPNKSPSKLLSSSACGNLEQVKRLMSAGVDVNVVDEYRNTCLHMACLHSSSATFKAGSTLYTADRSRNGHLLVVKYLLEQGGANVNAQDSKGYTPLILAARTGHLDIVKYLVEAAAADVNIQTQSGWTALNICCEKGTSFEMVEYLVEHGSALDLSDNKGCTPVLNAVRKGHLDIVRYLANAGADIHIADNIGRMPLYVAHEINHQELVTFLIEATPMATVRMPTTFTSTFHNSFVSPAKKPSFTSQRPIRLKDPELSDSSDDDFVGTKIESMIGTNSKKKKGRSSVKNSRSWIQFRELS